MAQSMRDIKDKITFDSKYKSNYKGHANGFPAAKLTKSEAKTKNYHHIYANT